MSEFVFLLNKGEVKKVAKNKHLLDEGTKKADEILDSIISIDTMLTDIAMSNKTSETIAGHIDIIRNNAKDIMKLNQSFSDVIEQEKVTQLKPKRR